MEGIQFKKNLICKGEEKNFKINYQELIENIPAATYITSLDESGRRLYISPQIEGMLGFSISEWLTNPQLWFRQVHPEDRKRVLAELYKSLNEGLPFRSEYRLISFEGRTIWVRDEAIIIRDEFGKPQFIQGFMFDLSDIMRAKETLQNIELKFRTIFERTALGIGLFSMKGMLMESNPSLQRMLGYNGKELYGKPLNELVHPEDEMIDLELYRRLLSGHHDHYYTEKRYIRKDGGVIWGRLNVSLVRDKEGEPLYTIHMVEDITEWKQMEIQFLQFQKMETVGRLAGGIAHDLNNLFTILNGYSQLSLLSLREDDPLRGNLEEIKKVTERASQLTHQLLTLSRRQILNGKVVDLNHLIRGIEKMLRRVIGEDIEFLTVLADDLGRVKVDSNQMEQVILNLIANARDAMPKGGRLVIETQNIELDEDYCRTHLGTSPGHYVMLSVSDTGCGMNPDVKEKIFDPFFTTKGKEKGTGLGLSTVYSIIKQSGGTIWVYSEIDMGTTFKIYLPSVEEEIEQIQSKDKMDELPKGNERVLLVEDESSVRNLSAHILRKQGYTVFEAANGDEALGIIRDHSKERIDLLITDMVMPQMGGTELVKHVKSIYPEIKVLFISGYKDSSIIHSNGFKLKKSFLEKPFSLNVFVKMVREILDQGDSFTKGE